MANPAFPSAAAIPVIHRIAAVAALVFGGLSLAFAVAVLVAFALSAQENSGLRALAFVTESSLALACIVIANGLLFGFMLVRNTRILQFRTRQRDIADDALVQSEARLRLAQAAAGIATTDWDIAADRAVWSSNFSEVFGLRPELKLQQSPYELFITLVHPADRPRVDAMYLRLLNEGGTFSDEFRAVGSDGDVRWIATRGEVFCDGKGIPRRLIGSNFDITERRRNEERLKHSLDILELANDAGEIGVWDNDFNSRQATIDERTRRILGLPAHDADFSFIKFVSLVHPNDQALVQGTFVGARRSGERFAVECRFRRMDGTTKWVRISGQADIDARTRRASRMTGIVFDITDRRDREQHLRFLMREITHRSKNLLAVIQAMARQTKSTTGSLDEFQNLFAARLQGLSASHDLLVNEDWHGAYLEDIIRSQTGHFIDLIGKRIHLSGPRLQLKPEAAQNIGMAMHELSTNAAKFGALSDQAGCIAITWGLKPGETGEPRLLLNWQESGGPQVRPPERRGFGSVVTERIVARALDGQVHLAFDPGGVHWKLEFPAKFILDPPPVPRE